MLLSLCRKARRYQGLIFFQIVREDRHLEPHHGLAIKKGIKKGEKGVSQQRVVARMSVFKRAKRFSEATRERTVDSLNWNRRDAEGCLEHG